jgi:hypothetical protein
MYRMMQMDQDICDLSDESLKKGNSVTPAPTADFSECGQSTSKTLGGKSSAGAKWP